MTDATTIDLCLLLVRCMLGGVMIAHGVNHIVGGGKIVGTARWFESLGMRPGILHAWLASATEIGAGVLLALGLLTSLGAAAALGVLLVAWITNHRGNGFFTFRPGEGWEYVMVLSTVCLVVGGLGAGSWSVDDALELTLMQGTSGLALAAGLGATSTLALLAVSWRPPLPPFTR